MTTPARIRSGWPKISPDRGLIGFLFESAADSSDAKISAVAGGATFRVNGGAAIPFTGPFWSTEANDNLLSYPFDLAPQISIIDDNDATLTGTWTPWNSNGDFAGVLYGGQIHFTTNLADTALYAFTGLTPGTYTLSIVPASNYRAGDVTDAAYSCDDGVLAAVVFHHDQSAPNLPQEDGLDRGVYWHDLGTVTVSGTTLNVTLSNAQGMAGTLAADAVRLELIQPKTIPAGATVTLDAPDGWVTTTIGDVAGSTALAVPIATAAEWYGYDPNVPVTMNVGRNENGPGIDSGARLHADMVRSGYGWEGIGGSLEYDEHDVPIGLGTATGVLCHLILNAGAVDGVSGRGANLLRAGAWKVRYHGTDTTPKPIITDTLNRNLFTTDAGTLSTDAASGKTVCTIVVTLADHLPLFPLGITVQFPNCPADGFPLDAEILDPDTPADWDKIVHPRVYNRVKGSGLTCLRWLDPLTVNTSTAVAFSELVDPLKPGFEREWGTLTATVAAIGPMDPAFNSLYPNHDNTSIIKVTTAAPHGFSTNHYVIFHLTNNNPPDTSGTGSTQTTDGSNGTGSYRCWIDVLSATEFHAVCYSTGGASTNTNAPNPITLPGPFDFGTGTVTVNLGTEQMGVQTIVQICNELDVVPWLLVPYTLSTQAVNDYADAVLAVLDAGRKIRLEWGNEHWNFNFAINGWLYIQGLRNGRSVSKEYTARAAAVHQQFRDRWTAAGRDPIDVYRVMGSQAGNSAVTTEILNGCILGSAMFDELAIDTYIDNQPRFQDYQGFQTEDFDRLDAAAILALFGLNQRYTDWPGWITPHTDLLKNTTDFPGFQTVKLVSYEGAFQIMVRDGSDPKRKVEKALAATRHPDMLWLYLARLQMLDSAGFTLYLHYIDSGANGLGNGFGWIARPIYYMPDGTGDGSDGQFNNTTGYFDYSQAVSVQGQAEKQYAALSLGSPPPSVSRYAFHMFMHFISGMRS